MVISPIAVTLIPKRTGRLPRQRKRFVKRETTVRPFTFTSLARPGTLDASGVKSFSNASAVGKNIENNQRNSSKKDTPDLPSETRNIPNTSFNSTSATKQSPGAGNERDIGTERPRRFFRLEDTPPKNSPVLSISQHDPFRFESSPIVNEDGKHTPASSSLSKRAKNVKRSSYTNVPSSKELENTGIIHNSRNISRCDDAPPISSNISHHEPFLFESPPRVKGKVKPRKNTPASGTLAKQAKNVQRVSDSGTPSANRSTTKELENITGTQGNSRSISNLEAASPKNRNVSISSYFKSPLNVSAVGNDASYSTKKYLPGVVHLAKQARSTESTSCASTPITKATKQLDDITHNSRRISTPKNMNFSSHFQSPLNISAVGNVENNLSKKDTPILCSVAQQTRSSQNTPDNDTPASKRSHRATDEQPILTHDRRISRLEDGLSNDNKIPPFISRNDPFTFMSPTPRTQNAKLATPEGNRYISSCTIGLLTPPLKSTKLPRDVHDSKVVSNLEQESPKNTSVLQEIHKVPSKALNATRTILRASACEEHKKVKSIGGNTGTIITSTPLPNPLKVGKPVDRSNGNVSDLHQVSLNESPISFPIHAASEQVKMACTGTKKSNGNQVDHKDKLAVPVDSKTSQKVHMHSDQHRKSFMKERTTLGRKNRHGKATFLWTKDLTLRNSRRETNKSDTISSFQDQSPLKRKNTERMKERKRQKMDMDLTIIPWREAINNQQSKLDTDIGVFLEIFRDIISEFSERVTRPKEKERLQIFSTVVEEELQEKIEQLSKYHACVKQSKLLANVVDNLGEEVTSTTLERLRMESELFLLQKRSRRRGNPVDKNELIQHFMESMKAVNVTGVKNL